MSKLPKLNYNDLVVLNRLRTKFVTEFYSNVTGFFISELFNYIDNHQVFRSSIMGEPRKGKSEVAQTIALIYKKYFNECMKQGVFDEIDLFQEKIFKKQEITFTPDNIIANQSSYIATLRKQQKESDMKFGQIWIIDENKARTGGIGSYTEDMELKNINNICAKFMQCEIWIQPDKFQTRNCPYGLYIYKKDTINRINWCLLYKIEITAASSFSYPFLGWVGFPLHLNDELRKAYNIKKNAWIKKEIDGTGDTRMEDRAKLSESLSKDSEFCEFTKSDKQFKLSISQQIGLVEEWIRSGKTHNWNDVELYRIVSEARRLVMRNKYRETRKLPDKDEKEKIGFVMPGKDERGRKIKSRRTGRRTVNKSK